MENSIYIYIFPLGKSRDHKSIGFLENSVHFFFTLCYNFSRLLFVIALSPLPFRWNVSAAWTISGGEKWDSVLGWFYFRPKKALLLQWRHLRFVGNPWKKFPNKLMHQFVLLFSGPTKQRIEHKLLRYLKVGKKNNLLNNDFKNIFL